VEMKWFESSLGSCEKNTKERNWEKKCQKSKEIFDKVHKLENPRTSEKERGEQLEQYVSFRVSCSCGYHVDDCVE